MSGLFAGDILPATTWANRPAASTVPAGAILPVTDLGATSVMFQSDGTAYWRPLAGKVELYRNPVSSLASPCATLTGNGTNQAFTLSTPCLLPAGMLFPGSRIEAQIFLRKSGTHTGQVAIDLSTTTGLSSASRILLSGASATSGSYVRGQAEACIGSGGMFTTSVASLSGNSGTSTSSAPSDRTDANILTEARYVVFGITTSYTDSAADLIAYSVSLAG